MDNTFQKDEKLYRAVFPPEHSNMYWKSDGRVSSAAFSDPKGLSVERGFYRKDSEVVLDMSKMFIGRIISITVEDCMNNNVKVIYCPTNISCYHSELHGYNKIQLSRHQRHQLALVAKIESY